MARSQGADEVVSLEKLVGILLGYERAKSRIRDPGRSGRDLYFGARSHGWVGFSFASPIEKVGDNPAHYVGVLERGSMGTFVEQEKLTFGDGFMHGQAQFGRCEAISLAGDDEYRYINMLQQIASRVRVGGHEHVEEELEINP